MIVVSWSAFFGSELYNAIKVTVADHRNHMLKNDEDTVFRSVQLRTEDALVLHKFWLF